MKTIKGDRQNLRVLDRVIKVVLTKLSKAVEQPLTQKEDLTMANDNSDNNSKSPKRSFSRKEIDDLIIKKHDKERLSFPKIAKYLEEDLNYVSPRSRGPLKPISVRNRYNLIMGEKNIKIPERRNEKKNSAVSKLTKSAPVEATSVSAQVSKATQQAPKAPKALVRESTESIFITMRKVMDMDDVDTKSKLIMLESLVTQSKSKAV